ncbi:MAG: replicative DNA helicase [Lentisphaerae bacterium]|nr:replicative DNA helicase [Lentisphaerota bacterium]
MPREPASSPPRAAVDRVPPYSEEAERGVLGSVLLDAERVMDLCIEAQITPDSFHVPAHRHVYESLLDLARESRAIDVVTLTEQMQKAGRLEPVGGAVFLERLIDGTPTAAHAEYYVDLVRQKHLLRCIIECSREAEGECYTSQDSADLVLGRVEQAFMDITERQHGAMTSWKAAIQRTMEHVEHILTTRRGLTGISTGYANLDARLHGLREGEMVVLAARPSMGKTALAMNIAERVALGERDPDRTARPVGIFSLEMSHEALVLRMLCSHARVEAFKISGGYISHADHGNLTAAASVLSKARIYLDDTGGLDILELRARARRMRKKHEVQLIVVDYLQLLHSQEYARQGRQLETAHISGNLKAMAKELRVPVLVLSQLSRAGEQRGERDKRPKLSDLRDSGAIEQDADVVCMLRRPCKYGEEDEDPLLAVVDVAKQRNGPTGEIELNFEEEYIRFEDRAHGVDDAAGAGAFAGELEEVPEEAGGVAP